MSLARKKTPDTDYDHEIPSVVRDVNQNVDEMKEQFWFEFDYLRIENGFTQNELATAIGEIENLETLNSPTLNALAKIIALRIKDVLKTTSTDTESANKAFDEVRTELIMSYIPRIPKIDKTREEIRADDIKSAMLKSAKSKILHY